MITDLDHQNSLGLPVIVLNLRYRIWGMPAAGY